MPPTEPAANQNAEAAAILKAPSISPEQLYQAKLLPLSRGAIYAACNTGEIESFRLGKKIVIPTAPLRRRLGIAAA